ncbi:lysophospholipid acyltransferase family protein [Paracoccus aestuariivivens]|uniref:1-acyl-sn-glycerol-3-phosphate acyltransferase n=1 Tax=Paracoccus aestuariivivens TaxID=1820333 RepID=A0A6L6JC47_9RHOB|nr:lysophospholipid acyltransferase family protein [Paracoccus aestuariivivens]MTH79056.1 1-acyl-sn-glycerol-3-phosphate acyltransferase [Paracoccus aestuariivivens]
MAFACGRAITFFAHAVTAVRPMWLGFDPKPLKQRVYFSNHASHGDFILIWSVLPPRQRQVTRPVAGADYWRKGKLRSYIGSDVFNALLIERSGAQSAETPVDLMAKALDEGASLIIFPEGTRNLTDATLLPFKSGIFHLARLRPQTEFVPVWIENLNRVLPKGAFIPVPLMCEVVFGAPMKVQDDETKDEFLMRSRDALLALRPRSEAS